MSKAADVQTLVEQTVQTYGRLNCAFNNAAIEQTGLRPTADCDEAEFDRLVNGLGGARGGAIYSATKAGVLALTKSAAQEYARYGIRVNALAAGVFRTPMLDRAIEGYAEQASTTMEDVEARYLSLVPMGRIGRPEEAADVALWLCSDAASYVTGHTMIADGGMTAPVR